MRPSFNKRRNQNIIPVAASEERPTRYIADSLPDQPEPSATLWEAIRSQGVRTLVEQLTDDEAIATTERFGAHNYHPLPVNIVRAEGALVYDGAGTAYIDCIGGYSAVSHGHLSPFVGQTVRDQIEKLTLVSRAMYSSEMALFLKALCEYTGMDRACPMNTGVEAVETCLKIARKWAYTVKGVPAGKAEIIVADGNFHGRTISVVSFSSEEGYKRDFGPFTPGFRAVPFGDLTALRAAINARTAAVLLEPIQAEGGIIVPPPGYLAGVRRLCNRHNVLLIWDEVQTGFCRTGRRFAWQHEEAEPDLMAVGKPLGGGFFPVSAAVGKEHAVGVLRPGDHGSTFGGNPLGCAIGLAAMAELEVQDLAGRSRDLGALFKQAFERRRHAAVAEVRGRGLLIGVEVAPNVNTERLGRALIRQRLLTKETRQRTFRFGPPLTIDEPLLREIVARFFRALSASTR